MKSAVLSVAAVLLLLGCAKSKATDASAEPSPAPSPTADAPKQATATTLAPLPEKKFGVAITVKNETALNDVIKSPDKFASATIRTQGVVSAVCQAAGCWMELQDDAGLAHVRMSGHSFFVPKSASGHRALVQAKVLPNNKDHCSEEAEQQTGKVATIQLEAVGVEFID